ncbi:MAG: hypothetical protein C0469_08860 [Cyanobacteria bacterium DS2.3.42]|nr:hypothetical protein [Cyanobacteria bacterium DS2.3.42]
MISNLNETADPAKIEELDRLTKGRLPREYLEFLKHSNIDAADIPVMPYLFIPFDVTEVIDGINGLRYEVPSTIITIGTDGCGGLIVLDMEMEPPCVASVDPICSDETAYYYLLGHSFNEFEQMLGKEPDATTIAAIERRKEIPLAASAALDARFWTKEQISTKTKELELDKYAPEFDPIAAKDRSAEFIGVRKDDGTVWNVPCLGTKHLKADKMADSLQQLFEFMTELKDLNKLDDWRYYKK